MSRKILVFSAHAADFCSRAGGTLIKAVADGCKVHVIVTTYGERGESSKAWTARPLPDIATVKQIRKNEVKRAAQVLGCSVQFLDFDDNPLYINPERSQIILELIQEYAPDIILTHWRIETLNPDHEVISNEVLKAAHNLRCAGKFPGQLLPRYPTIYLFEPSVPHTDMVDFHPDFYVDISSVWSKKLEALKILESQPALVSDYTIYGQFRGFQAKGISGNEEVKYAEAFIRFQPLIGDLWKLPL